MNNESSHPFIESQLDTNIFIHGIITNGVKWAQREKEIVLNSDLLEFYWVSEFLSFTTCDT